MAEQSCYEIVGGESESGLTITNCLNVYENGILKDSTLLASRISVHDEVYCRTLQMSADIFFSTTTPLLKT